MSGVRTLARARAQARKLRRKLGDTYAAAEQERTAGVRADGLVDVEGQLYRAEGVTGNSGQTAVVNVARLAAAVYRPVQRTTVAVVGGGGGGSGGGGGLIAHDLDGVYHTGTLSWAKVNKIGSDLADLETRQYASLTNRGHALAGADHTASGLTTGHTLRATGATTFAWAQLQHGDLGGVTANQHHNQQHNIVGGDHTVTGAQWQVVGLTGTNTLGLLTPSYDPGSAAAILRTADDGSLNIADELLTADATQRNVWINSGTPDGSAALRVQAYANDDVTVHIKQKSGQTGRLWKVSDAAGQELIVLTNNGSLQSGNPGFVSGLTGWQMTPEGRLEALDGWFRGELHASIFVMDEFHATGGTLVVATAGPLENDAVIDSTTVQTLAFAIDTADVGGVAAFSIDTADVGGVAAFAIETVQNYLDITDPASGHAQIFGIGDTLRCKTFNGTGVYDIWLTVIGVEDQTDYWRYYVVKRSGTDTILPAGSAVISYGQAGDGRILLTSDLNYAPYLDVFTVGAEPWNGDLIPHTRLGRLDGVGVDGVGGVEQYGLIAGTDLSDNDSPYVVVSNTQVKLHKVNLQSYNGVNQTVDLTAAGAFKLGTGVANPNTTGLSFDPVTGNLAIGNASYPGTVTVRGSITVTGGDAATQTYASNAATAAGIAAVATAGAYADTVGDAAQSYADARRVVAVTGVSYAVSATPTVTINGGSIRLGNGATKALTDGTLVASSNGTYFIYVDVTVSAPLTVNWTTSLASLGSNHGVLGVFTRAAADSASLVLAPGNTYIGSSGIITGAIKTGHIAANQIVATHIQANAIESDQIKSGAVTANKINVSSLSAMQTNTGSLSVTGILTMGAAGQILSYGKTYGGASAGFYLGYDTSAYKFDIGDNNNYLRWSGSALSLRTRSPLVLETTSDASHAIQFVNSAGQTAEIKFNYQFGSDFNCFVFNRDVSGGNTKSLIGWTNVLSQAFTNTVGGSANLVNTTINKLTFDGNPATDLINLFTNWVGLVPATDWSNYRSGSLAYCKMGDMVIVRGSVTRTATSSTLITTLPVGVRPQQDIDSPIYVQGVTSYRSGFITIETDGEIRLGNGGAYSGNSISFLVINAVFTTRN